MFHTTLTGLSAYQKSIANASHNIANAKNFGYKRSTMTFTDVSVSSREQASSLEGYGTRVQRKIIDVSNGAMIATPNALDLAITGDGFFMVAESPEDKKTTLTRNGSFSVNESGFVTNLEGQFLLNIEKKPISIQTSVAENVYSNNFSVTSPASLSQSAGSYNGWQFQLSDYNKDTTARFSIAEDKYISQKEGQISIKENKVFRGTGDNYERIGLIEQSGAKLEPSVIFQPQTNVPIEKTIPVSQGAKYWDFLETQVFLGHSQIAGTTLSEDPTYAAQNTKPNSSDLVEVAGQFSVQTGDIIRLQSQAILENQDTILRGPAVANKDPIAMKKGDKFEFAWKSNTTTRSDVFAYLFDVDTGRQVEVINKTSASNPDWTISSTKVEFDGNYKFVFVSGGYVDANTPKIMTQSVNEVSLNIEAWQHIVAEVILGETEIEAFKTPIDSNSPIPAPAPVETLEKNSSFQIQQDVAGGIRLLSTVSSSHENTLVRGPAISMKQPIYLTSGQTVRLEWEASGDGDADVFAYLINTETGKSTELVNTTDPVNVGSQSVKVNVPEDDSYKVVLVGGSVTRAENVTSLEPEIDQINLKLENWVSVPDRIVMGNSKIALTKTPVANDYPEENLTKELFDQADALGSYSIDTPETGGVVLNQNITTKSLHSVVRGPAIGTSEPIFLGERDIVSIDVDVSSNQTDNSIAYLVNVTSGEQIVLKKEALAESNNAIRFSGAANTSGDYKIIVVAGSYVNNPNSNRIENVKSSLELTPDNWDVYEEQIFLGQTNIAGAPTPLDTKFPTINTRGQMPDGKIGNDSPPVTSSNFDIEFGSDGIVGKVYGLTENSAIVRGPAVSSKAPLALKAGDTLDLEIMTKAGSDQYDIFVYLLNADNNETVEVINKTGAGQEKESISFTVPKDGDYKLVFVGGSYDYTNGGLIEAAWRLENVSLNQQTADYSSEHSVEIKSADILRQKKVYASQANVGLHGLSIITEKPEYVVENDVLLKDMKIQTSENKTHPSGITNDDVQKVISRIAYSNVSRGDAAINNPTLTATLINQSGIGQTTLTETALSSQTKRIENSYITDIETQANGEIIARYANQTKKNAGTIGVATVIASQDLTEIGNAQFDALEGVVLNFGEIKRGSIQSGTIEMSNIDLNEELTELMLTQRRYQATSKALQAESENIQKIVDVR